MKTVKKVVKKTVKKAKPVDKPKYKLEVTLNDVPYVIETNDIKSSLLELKPPIIKTRFKITISTANSRFDRIMMVRMAKLLFNNNLTMDTFVKQVTTTLQ